jgi:hypothetical protein
MLLAIVLLGAAPPGERVAFRLPGPPEVLFVEAGSVTERRPDIVVAEKRVGLGEKYAQAGWIHVAATPDGRRVFAVLDTVVESPGWTLHVLRSEDGGRTWPHAVELKKPHYFATFQGLRLGADGRGELTVVLADDYGAGVAPGEYVARTKDGGRTWSAFQRRPDILRHADPD